MAKEKTKNVRNNSRAQVTAIEKLDHSREFGIWESTDKFHSEMRSISVTVPRVNILLEEIRSHGMTQIAQHFFDNMNIDELRDFAEELKSVAEGNKPSGAAFELRSKHGDAERFTRQLRYSFATFHSRKLINRSLLFTCVSQFDAYISAMARYIISAHPGILDRKERVLTFSALSGFSSIDEARQSIVDKEIDDLMRGSHAEQISWIMNSLGMKFDTEMVIWKNIIEITERRNLFAHTDGRVSQQYIGKCKNAGLPLDHITPGMELECDPTYLLSAIDTLMCFSAMLSYSVFRKMNEDKIDFAEKSVIRITNDFLYENRFQAAYELTRLVLSKGHAKLSNEFNKKNILLLSAEAAKMLGDANSCSAIIDSDDWSASPPFFLFLRSLIKDDLGAAVRILPRLKGDENLKSYMFYERAMFLALTGEEGFVEAYRLVFGEEFKSSEEDVSIDTSPELSGQNT